MQQLFWVMLGIAGLFITIGLIVCIICLIKDLLD